MSPALILSQKHTQDMFTPRETCLQKSVRLLTNRIKTNRRLSPFVTRCFLSVIMIFATRKLANNVELFREII